MGTAKDLDKAFNLAVWSMLCSVLPLVGIVLAISAVSLVASTSSGDADSSIKKKTTLLLASLGIVLTVFFAFGYKYAYEQFTDQMRRQEQATEAEQRKQYDAAKSACYRDAEQKKLYMPPKPDGMSTMEYYDSLPDQTAYNDAMTDCEREYGAL